MAEIWGLALVAGATVVSGAMAADAAGDAADSANAGQNASIAEQRRRDAQFQENISPYLEFGQQSIGQLNALNGGDYSGFMDSPDYLAAMQGGTEGINRAAIGNLSGGGTAADLVNFGQRAAANYLGNYRSALQFGTNLGQNAAVGAGQMGQNSANAIGGAYGQMGINSGNAAIGQANAWGDAITGLAGVGSAYMGQKNQSSYNPQQTGNFGPFNPNVGYTGANAFGQYGQSWGG